MDINISAPNKGAALEQLLRVLNSADFVDYRIGSGIQPGNLVEEPEPVTPPKKTAAKTPAQPNPLELRIREYIGNNKLIRLNINKGRGVKMSIPCRVINFDASNQLLTVYHVDEKQVYSFGLNEIDDFVD
ncbi:hypothetical protein K7P76_13515 [Cohnella sp. NL03-T5]|nr:hypothetical protein [Cohnella silvisoli]